MLFSLKLMLGKQTVAATTESSTIATRVSPATMEKISNEREDLGVTISRNMVMQRICWDIYGKPVDWILQSNGCDS